MNKNEYPADETQAAIIVLAELLTYLGPYRDDIVVIGGWVPFFLTQGIAIEEPHVGSLDVDLALNVSKIADAAYSRIEEILAERRFEHRLDTKGNVIPHSYIRRIKNADGQEFDVQVDFLAPEYGGTAKSKRHQRVQGLLAQKARGSDLVFDHFEERDIEAVLPNGAKRLVKARIADPLSCVVMKAIAFRERAHEKDAYDLYVVCKYCPNGKERIAEGMRRGKSNKLISEALEVLRKEFATVDSLGPVSVADFLEEKDEVARTVRCRDVLETIQAIIALVSEGKR